MSGGRTGISFPTLRVLFLLVELPAARGRKNSSRRLENSEWSLLTKGPTLLLNDNDTGKPEGIHLMTGRRSVAAFGNSTGDRRMLKYTKAGDGARLSTILLHDDAARVYAYGPRTGLPDTKVGTFTQPLYDNAGKDGWTIISMKDDWRRIFSFED